MSQITDQIDAALSTLWPSVVSQQNAYHLKSGAYYQMLWTHGKPPNEMTAPDSLDVRPTDQPHAQVSGLPLEMRSRMRIDTYGQPAGWTMTLEAEIEGQVWRKSIDCGTDLSRSATWHVLDTVSS